MRGIVLEYYAGRRFGYLKDEEKDEYCFYSSDILSRGIPLKKGDRVSFHLYKGRGTRAVDLQKENQEAKKL